MDTLTTQYDGAETQVTKERVVFKAVFFWYLCNDGYLIKYDIFYKTEYRVRHKSVNTPVRHTSVNTPSSHERHAVRTWLAVYSGWG